MNRLSRQTDAGRSPVKSGHDRCNAFRERECILRPIPACLLNEAASPLNEGADVQRAVFGESGPAIIPGKPAKAHWDIADPAAAQGAPDEIEAAFRRAYDMLAARIEAFAASE